MKNYLQITLRTTSEMETEILIATLSDHAFYAFEQEEFRLVGYINENDYEEKSFHELVNPANILSTEIIPEENWNQQWESTFKPVTIGDFAIIRASFHESPPGILHDLIITPKMSFGTGHHATTYLMVAQMKNIAFEKKRVLDFGTGTGVLAILAEKMGAADVIAIDLDEWSINNTLENIQTNHCHKIKVEQRDHLNGLPKAEIILANINLNVLKASAASIAAIQDKGSLLLTSGFLKKDAEEIESIFTRENYQHKMLTEKDNWLSMLFEKI